MSEENVTTPVDHTGAPWTMVGIYSSFEDADSKRKSVSGAFAKVRRRSDGTFTVHTRNKAPGKSQGKATKKKRTYGK